MSAARQTKKNDEAVFDRRDLVPEQVPVEDIPNGPREHLALEMAEREPVLLPGPVARHGLHRVHHAVELVVTHPAALSSVTHHGQALLVSIAAQLVAS